MAAGNKIDDVVVIGAGLVGALIAHTLAKGGRRVAVLEAQQVAQGATRHAIGLATPHLIPSALADTLRGVDELTSLSMRLGVPPRSCRVLHLATQPAGVEALRDLHQSFTADRPKLVWESKPNALPSGFDAGLVTHYSVLVDAAALSSRLLEHRNITVREYAEVHALEWHSGQLVALAHGYTVNCSALVLATNAYAGLLSPYLADAVQLARGYSWSSRPLNDERALVEYVSGVVPMPMIVDDGQILAAQTQDHRLQITAWRPVRDTASNPEDDVQRFLHERLPDLLGDTQEHHSGVTTMARDGAPLVGKLVGEGSVYYALGAGVYGLAWAPVIAARIANMVDQDSG